MKDKEIAARMIKLMSLITIGTCHEGQLRATTILDFIADSYEAHLPNGKLEVSKPLEEGFFEFSHHLLADRWKKLRAAVNRCGAFNLPDYSAEYCDFMNKTTHPNPGILHILLFYINSNILFTLSGTHTFTIYIFYYVY